MANEAEIISELNAPRDDDRDREMELQRLVACYELASSDDRRVIWAALNKYAPCIDL